VHSVEVAARVTEELANFSGANFDTVSQLSEDFLANIKVGVCAAVMCMLQDAA